MYGGKCGGRPLRALVAALAVGAGSLAHASVTLAAPGPKPDPAPVATTPAPANATTVKPQAQPSHRLVRLEGLSTKLWLRADDLRLHTELEHEPLDLELGSRFGELGDRSL